MSTDVNDGYFDAGIRNQRLRWLVFSLVQLIRVSTDVNGGYFDVGIRVVHYILHHPLPFLCHVCVCVCARARVCVCARVYTPTGGM